MTPLNGRLGADRKLESQTGLAQATLDDIGDAFEEVGAGLVHLVDEDMRGTLYLSA
ncbi:hypothetical protein [Methylobacterium sp.]|uniref:hypothetical protein n=1 Tax=Methylobacterium sp. TaxID=409 RepID=UPI003B02E12C